jgi:diguanylate cyclase
LLGLVSAFLEPCNLVSLKKVQSPDTAAKVITVMRRYGISALPRNYELVYEFLNASNEALIREFRALGESPTQLQLDAIGKKFFAHHHATKVAEVAHDRISHEMQDVVGLLEQDQSNLQNFATLLGENASRISQTSASNAKILNGLVEVLSSATGDTMEKGNVIVRHMVDSVQAMERVKSELDEYKRLAKIDPLTKLYNRRAFDERLSSVYEDNRTATSHALLVADIDHFKKLNDTYGHPVGDRVLSVVATVMTKSVGREAFIARTGGEEFAIILRGTSLEVTVETAELIRHAIEATPFRNQKVGLDYGRITMSIGLCMATHASSAEELYSRADAALYAAKNSGRNRLKVYNPEMNLETDRK